MSGDGGVKASAVPAAVQQYPDDRIERLLAAYGRSVAARRWRTLLLFAAVAAAAMLAGFAGEVDLRKLVVNLHRFPDYLREITPELSLANWRGDLADWYWNLDRWLKLLLDTLLIAYLGTLMGVIGGFLLCFSASANLVRSRAVRFVARRSLEFCRTVPNIVFALIFVVAFGLGAMPGVLAIAVHTMGALGKLFAEVVENIDMKPVEGVVAAGGTWVETVRYAVVPQVIANFTSYALLRFEINVREATVIGFVGAGGIGQDLLEAIRKFYYSDVSAILLLIIATVMVIDMTTEQVRHGLIGMRGRR